MILTRNLRLFVSLFHCLMRAVRFFIVAMIFLRMRYVLKKSGEFDAISANVLQSLSEA